MEFATMMKAMCAIRGKYPDYLCDVLKIDNAVMALIKKNEIVPVGNLEERIRRELNWPREIDDLIDEINQAIYEKVEAVAEVISEPLVEDREPAPVEAPIIKPSQILQKHRGRPSKNIDTVLAARKTPDPFKKRESMSYLQRPAIGSDGETGSVGTLHGSVVA